MRWVALLLIAAALPGCAGFTRCVGEAGTFRAFDGHLDEATVVEIFAFRGWTVDTTRMGTLPEVHATKTVDGSTTLSLDMRWAQRPDGDGFRNVTLATLRATTVADRDLREAPDASALAAGELDALGALAPPATWPSPGGAGPFPTSPAATPTVHCIHGD